MQIRRLLAVGSIVAGLAIAGCGSDDGDTSTDSASTASTTVETTSTAATGTDMTAGDYMAASLPDQVQVVKALVAEHPDECGDVDPKPGGDFQIAFAIDAAQAAPETPLDEIIVGSCAEAGNGTS